MAVLVCIIALSMLSLSWSSPSGACPFEDDFLNEGGKEREKVDPVALANRAVHELFYVGRIKEALACHRLALQHVPAALSSATWVKSIQENTANLVKLMGPRLVGFPRVYHGYRANKSGDDLVSTRGTGVLSFMC